MSTKTFTARFPAELEKNDHLVFGLHSRKNLGTSAGFGTPVMNPITTDVGYEWPSVKSYTVFPIDGTDDHTFRAQAKDITVNITQGIRGVLDESTYDASDSFYIHSLTVFSDRVDVVCSVADRGLCHVGLLTVKRLLTMTTVYIQNTWYETVCVMHTNSKMV
jgi:hypothetical protein